MLFLPLDVPKIEIDKEVLIRYFDKYSVRTTKPYFKYLDYPWKIALQKDATIQGSDESNWIPFIGALGNIKTVIDSLPFESIEMVYMFEQIIDVKHHIDYTKDPDYTTEPSSYRFTLLHEYNKSFYVCDKDDGNRIFTSLPLETNCWVIRSRDHYHGAIKPPIGYRKITLGISGKVNKEEHINLLKKSFNKYNKFAIFKKDVTPNS